MASGSNAGEVFAGLQPFVSTGIVEQATLNATYQEVSQGSASQDVDIGWLNGGVWLAYVVTSHAGGCDSGSEVWLTMGLRSIGDRSSAVSRYQDKPMLRSRHRRRQFGQSHQVAAAMVVSAHRRLRAIPQFPFATGHRFHPSEGLFNPLPILLTDPVAIVGGW